MQCPKFLQHILTEPDNKTFCPIRILAVMGVLVFLTITCFHYKQHAVWDPQQFSIGFGALITGVGAALGFKKDSPIS